MLSTAHFNYAIEYNKLVLKGRPRELFQRNPSKELVSEWRPMQVSVMHETSSIWSSTFPRVDAKLSTVLAINTAMLGEALGAMVPPLQTVSWPMAIAPALSVILLGFSYFFLYRGGFPVTKGGYASLIYFKNIAQSAMEHPLSPPTRISVPRN